MTKEYIMIEALFLDISIKEFKFHKFIKDTSIELDDKLWN